MKYFTMNGHFWRVIFVHPTDERLIDRTGNLTVATTDPATSCIYLSEDLSGEFLEHVFIHELGHATMVSYGLLDILHSMSSPQKWIEIEEWICNFIADYGFEIFSIASNTLGDSAWRIAPFGVSRYKSA